MSEHETQVQVPVHECVRKPLWAWAGAIFGFVVAAGLSYCIYLTGRVDGKADASEIAALEIRVREGERDRAVLNAQREEILRILKRLEDKMDGKRGP